MRTVDLRSGAAKHLLLIVALAVIAASMAWIATQNGLSVSWDSGYYVAFAQNIRAGNGLSVRISGYSSTGLLLWLNAFPPLYPMILALGSNVFAWARLLDVLTFAAAVALTYALAYRVTRRTWVALASALVYLTIPTVISEVYSTPLSESVFTVFVLAIVLLMTNYRFGEAPKSMRPALYAAGLSVLAMLTRYLGMTVAAGMIVYSVLWARSIRGRRRWLPALMFLLSFIPLFLYSLYLYGLTGNLTGGQPNDQPLKFWHISESLRQMSLQLFHGVTFLGNLIGVKSNWWTLGIAALLIALLALIIWRSRPQLRRAFNSSDALLAVYVAIYLLGFWILGLRSSWIVADWRHYVPIYPAIIILLVHLFTLLPIKRGVMGGIVALYCLSGVAAIPTTLQGLYWNTEDWRTDPIVADLPTLIPKDALIHGNEVSYLASHLGVDVTLRTFGSWEGFRDYPCSQLTYPPGFSTAVFTLFDSDMLRGMTPEAAKTYFTNWASPCGTVENFVSDPFAMVMVVHLNGR